MKALLVTLTAKVTMVIPADSPSEAEDLFNQALEHCPDAFARDIEVVDSEPMVPATREREL